MKTVRFSAVVEKSGRPQVYLLLTKDDLIFQKALGANRVMTLPDSGQAKAAYGVVGYDEKKRGQLLLFPRSLARFADSRIVGIKYELFSDDPERADLSPAKTRKKPQLAKRSKAAKSIPTPTKKEPVISPRKILPFPGKDDNEETDESAPDLKSYARQALRELEKGRTSAVRHLLQTLIHKL